MAKRSRPITSKETHRGTPPREGAPGEPGPAEGPSTSSSGTEGISEGMGSPQAPRAPQGSSELVASLGAALGAAVDRAVKDRPQVSLLFSGGLDSALLALLLRRHVRAGALELELVTVGTAGALDLAQAERAASLLELPWAPHTVTPDEVRAAAKEVQTRAVHPREEVSRLTGLSVEVQTGLFLAMQRASRTTVLCGQGADELFLGYAHFRPLPEARLQARYVEDLDRLQKDDLPLSTRLAASLGLELRAPYLDPAWKAVVDPIPLERRRARGVPKELLREVARSLGLPTSLADAPKKALQYGSGVHAALSSK